MGYRLEFKDPNHPEKIIYAEGGKLFGYIANHELENYSELLSLDVVCCLWY